jgi:AcrR family transcriptional regulator
MSPRGRAIPGIRERLFRAAERVLLDGGPGAISARAVAGEAGVAVGVLYNHFEDLDGFLAELVIDRFRVQAQRLRGLPQLAGSRTVAENLADAAAGLLQSPTLAVAELVRARPGLSQKITTKLGAGAPGIREVQAAIAAYLEGERHLGRVAADADTEVATLILVGTMHHLLLLHGHEPPKLRQAAHRAVGTVLAGITERQP